MRSISHPSCCPFPKMSQNFLSCDWGTSHFRLRMVNARSLEILAEIKTDDGAARIFQRSTPETRANNFAEILACHIGAIFRQTGREAISCIVSGMASSVIGWMELPYSVAPLLLEAGKLNTQTLILSVGKPPVEVTIVSGIRTDDDLMRGEECELLGLLDLFPVLASSDCWIVLPGTHSKHVWVANRTLMKCVTNMTGELFSHLHTTPTLKSMLSQASEISEARFREGIWAAKRFGLLAGLFKVRSQALISKAPLHHESSFLSGLLIGSELLTLPPHKSIYLAASGSLRSLYQIGAREMGLPLKMLSSDTVQKALVHAHRMFLPRDQ